jgi:hypothetical protein
MSTPEQRAARRSGGWLAPHRARALRERNAEIIRANYDMRERIKELVTRLDERDKIIDRLVAARTDPKIDA